MSDYHRDRPRSFAEAELLRLTEENIRIGVREARLLSAVMHVVRYGRLGKQSKARLKAAVRENAAGRTHGLSDGSRPRASRP